METHDIEKIVDALFPSHPVRPNNDLGGEMEFPLFTAEELEKAVLSMKTKKAPGPDGIPTEVMKAVYHNSPHLLLRMYNACLAAGVFPKR